MEDYCSGEPGTACRTFAALLWLFVNLVRREALFYHFSAGETLHGKKILNLAFPKNALLFAIYRQKDFLIPKGDVEIHKDDELVFILKETAIDELKNALGVQ